MTFRQRKLWANPLKEDLQIGFVLWLELLSSRCFVEVQARECFIEFFVISMKLWLGGTPRPAWFPTLSYRWPNIWTRQILQMQVHPLTYTKPEFLYLRNQAVEFLKLLESDK